MDLIGLRGATVPSGGPQIDMAGARTAIIVNPPLPVFRAISGEPTGSHMGRNMSPARHLSSRRWSWRRH